MDHFQLPTLLIIADNPPVRFWLKKHLENQFYLIIAQKKEKAIEVVQHTRLDFIILDANFLDADPIDLTKELRQLNLLVPILLITGRLSKTYRESALEAGVTDFLFEQLDQEELETRIATGLKAAIIRKKTGELSENIVIPESALASDYLHHKFLLESEALHLLTHAREHQLPITIAIVRIDHYATQPQPEILPSFITLLKENLTKKDLLVPLSEGRFLLLLSKNLEEAKKIARTIQSKIKNTTATFAIVDLDKEQSFNEMIDAAIKTLKQTETVTNTIFSLDHES